MRSIVVFADRNDPKTSVRLEAALSLARAEEGHVTVLVDTPVARFMAMDAMGGSYLAADAIREAVQHDDAYAAELAAHLTREDVPFDILRSEDEPIDSLAACSLLADVIVLSRDCRFAGQLAVSTRAPVLIVPDAGMELPPRRVMIAWNGSDEAASALRAGLPLMRQAEQVELVTVGAKLAGFPAVDAVQYLSRHGVHAQLRPLVREGSVEETLARAVRDAGAQLLVMGAYGHSRLREFLLGGVTRYFLDGDTGVAMLLAH